MEGTMPGSMWDVIGFLGVLMGVFVSFAALCVIALRFLTRDLEDE